MTGRHVVYISFDGLLEPLGYSQVVRVVVALARRGVARFTILSLEKERDALDRARVAALGAELQASGVAWAHSVYRPGARGILRNLAWMQAQVLRRARGASLLHARSYLGGTVAMQAGAILRVPYLFDFRGYWVDERIEAGLWFTRPSAERVARLWERQLFQRAAGVVSLARPAAEDVLSGHFGPWDGRPVEVIPTSVDETAFVIGDGAALPAAISARLKDKLVIAYVGSMNPSYRFRESFRLFREIRALREDAHLLCLTREVEATRAVVLEEGVAPGDVTLTSATHRDMPGWLSRIDWGLLLLNSPFTKRGSMPTKLGEFFAAGVRPIQIGCNAEVDAWVARSGSGVTLSDTDEASLKRAAAEIAKRPMDREILEQARSRTMPHFALSAAVDRYAALYDRLLG